MGLSIDGLGRTSAGKERGSFSPSSLVAICYLKIMKSKFGGNTQNVSKVRPCCSAEGGDPMRFAAD